MNTQHSPSCSMAFGRYDMSCPRCQELANGAAPRRPAWTKRLGSSARIQASRLASIDREDIRSNPFSTKGQW